MKKTACKVEVKKVYACKLRYEPCDYAQPGTFTRCLALSMNGKCTNYLAWPENQKDENPQ